VQRALEPVAGVVGAILLQGLVFGGVHVAETSGAGRLGLWLSLSAVGVVHGFVYHRVKRSTASMCAHALFNAFGVVLIFATIRPF
jgi:membrane protease YdiL (CAAX protease family)